MAFWDPNSLKNIFTYIQATFVPLISVQNIRERPLLCKSYRAPRQSIYPASRGFSLAWLFAFIIACVAGAWKKWAKERTGAREGDTRGVMELPLPSRVSFSRARFFLCPLLPSACYAGYVYEVIRVACLLRS